MDYHEGDGGYFGFSGDDYGPTERVEDTLETRLRYREAVGQIAYLKKMGHTSQYKIMDRLQDWARGELAQRWTSYEGVYKGEARAHLVNIPGAWNHHEIVVVVGGARRPNRDLPHSWGATFRYPVSWGKYSGEGLTWVMTERPQVSAHRNRRQGIPPKDYGLDTTPARKSFEVVKELVQEFFHWYVPSVERHQIACTVEEQEIKERLATWWKEEGRATAEADIWASIERGDEKPFPPRLKP